jgi:hypothetical protein
VQPVERVHESRRGAVGQESDPGGRRGPARASGDSQNVSRVQVRRCAWPRRVLNPPGRCGSKDPHLHLAFVARVSHL